MCKPALILLTLVFGLGPAGAAVQDPWSTWKTPAEVRELLLNAAARERLGSEYDSLVWKGRLTPGQRTEFLNFLGELDLRIARQCRKLLRQNPGKDFSQLPCPGGGEGPAPELSTIDVASERTPEEAVAALDAELASGLGQYDEMLLEEQKKLASRSPVRSQSSGWGSNGGREAGEMQGSQGESGREAASESQESSEETGEGEYGEDQEQETRRTSGEMSSQRHQSTRSTEGGRKDGKREPPEDIPDGSDDDVVARQIREAAEKETDPKLRKKLWEEYRRYKTARR